MTTTVPFKPRPPRPEPTHDELERAFEKVHPKGHWKNPISAVIDAQDVEVCTDAVIYYTGTVPVLSATSEPDRFLLESIGYAAGPCGDH